MIKNTFRLLGLFFLLLAFNGCRKGPKFSDIPSIEFDKIEPTLNSSGEIADLAVSLKFKDGDGDLGLDPTERSNPPYEDFDFITKNNRFIEIGDQPNMPAYSCSDYSIGNYDLELAPKPADAVDDTVWIKKNPNHNNFFIDMYIDGNTLVDFSSACVQYGGAFPLLRPASYSGPIEGTLTYTIKGLDFITTNPDFSYLRNKNIKFKIYIQDRAFHHSNTIETPAMVLFK